MPDAEGVDSRLTATLQAILAASRFLDRGDADVINKAARVALDCAAAAAAAAKDGGGGKHAAEDSQGEGAAGLRQEWPGPNLAAMSLLTLLHMSKNRWEGIPAALDVLQQMVSGQGREGGGESKPFVRSPAAGAFPCSVGGCGGGFKQGALGVGTEGLRRAYFGGRQRTFPLSPRCGEDLHGKYVCHR